MNPGGVVVPGVDPGLLAAVFPLAEFYRRSGVALPVFERIDGAEVPEPWRTLLVH
jgi:hypothetical protein